MAGEVKNTEKVDSPAVAKEDEKLWTLWDDICDAVCRVALGIPGTPDSDPFRHTSDVSRATADRIMGVLMEHGVIDHWQPEQMRQRLSEAREAAPAHDASTPAIAGESEVNLAAMYGWALDGMGQEFVREASDLLDQLHKLIGDHTNGAVECALRALIAQDVVRDSEPHSMVGLRLLRVCQAMRFQLELEMDTEEGDGASQRVLTALDAATGALVPFADPDYLDEGGPYGH